MVATIAPMSASSMGIPSILGAWRRYILKGRSSSIIERPEAAARGRHQNGITLPQSHVTKSFGDSYQSMTLPNQQGPRIYLCTMDDHMRMPILGATPVAPHRR